MPSRAACHKVSFSPTVRALDWAIAAMGGHLKSNGEPGLPGSASLSREEGRRAAVQFSPECDQSKAVHVHLNTPDRDRPLTDLSFAQHERCFGPRPPVFPLLDALA
jgi:hypothetical protein